MAFRVNKTAKVTLYAGADSIEVDVDVGDFNFDGLSQDGFEATEVVLRRMHRGMVAGNPVVVTGSFSYKFENESITDPVNPRIFDFIRKEGSFSGRVSTGAACDPDQIGIKYEQTLCPSGTAGYNFKLCRVTVGYDESADDGATITVNFSAYNTDSTDGFEVITA